MILPVVMYSYIPNFLTFLRLFAAPVLILYLIIDQSFSGKYFGLIIFFFIILTDFFDGYLARKFNTESNIGKVFDPIADKIMVILLFAFFLGINLDNPEKLFMSLMLILLITREIMISGLREFVSAKKADLSVTQLARWKTFFQTVLLIFLFFDYIYLFQSTVISWSIDLFCLVTCLLTWYTGMQYIFKAFDMEAKGWKLVDPGSAAGLDGSIAKAVERKENWVGYYWSPTAIIGKYDMRLLDFGVKWGGDDNWHKCVVKPEQECATPKKTRWVDSEVYSVVTDNFKKSAGPEAMKFMKKRIYPGTVMNSMLVYMTDNQAEGEDAAIEFMKKHEKVWSKWVSSSVAKKIKAGI